MARYLLRGRIGLKMTTQDVTSLIKNFCIALTGGAGTGKSTVAAYLRQCGYEVFDADQCSRHAVEHGKPALTAIVQEFGPQVLSPDGTLDRSKLRSIVLSGSDSRRRLEAITHPAIQQQLAEEISTSDLVKHPKIFFYEAALIHEVGRAKDFLAVWCTNCDDDTQLKRLMERTGGLSREQANALMKAQLSNTEKARLSTLILDTSGSWDAVAKQVDKHLKALQRA